jgi:hypothetical protein
MVDHGALETELAHATLKLGNRHLDVVHGKMGKASVTIGPASGLGGKGVVRLSRSLDGKLRVAFNLDARTRHGEHGKLNARSIHGGKALLSEIREHSHDAIVFVLGHAWHRVSEVVEEIRNDEVLFKGNLIHRCLQLDGLSCPRLNRASLPQILMLKDLRVGVATPQSKDECLRMARVARLLAQFANAEGKAAFGAECHCCMNLRGLRPHVIGREAAEQLHER